MDSAPLKLWAWADLRSTALLLGITEDEALIRLWRVTKQMGLDFDSPLNLYETIRTGKPVPEEKELC